KSISFAQFLSNIQCEYKTKRLPISDQFWPAYEAIKAHKEKVRSVKSDLSIDKKAHHNLKVALKIIDASQEENRAFMNTLIDDIKHYYTMPTYTLRRLAFEKLNPNSAKAKWDRFWTELEAIKKE